MPTLHEALLVFLKVDRRPATNHQYGLVLNRFVSAVGPQRSVDLVSYEDILDYFDRLAREGLKQSTRQNYLATTKSFFKWCVERRYIEESPAQSVNIKRPRSDPDNVRAIPPDELSRMVEYARITSPRNYAIMLFFADTGCRVSGLVSLERANINLDLGHARITEKGGHVVDVYFGDTTARALAHWLSRRPQVDHDFVWTGQAPDYAPLKRESIAAVVYRLAERTEASRRWGPHSIRHSVGHALARRGVPVTITSRKLNHRDPNVTMSYYYPQSTNHVIEVSRQHSLASLLDEDTPPVPRIVPKK